MSLFEDKVWIYKRHLCRVVWDCDVDNAKAFHTIVTPEDKEIYADLDPYNGSKELVELWIDAGLPEKIKTSTGLNRGPLNSKQLRTIIKIKGKG
jgi:hypothetical protein